MTRLVMALLLALLPALGGCVVVGATLGTTVGVIDYATYDRPSEDPGEPPPKRPSILRATAKGALVGLAFDVLAVSMFALDCGTRDGGCSFGH